MVWQTELMVTCQEELVNWIHCIHVGKNEKLPEYPKSVIKRIFRAFPPLWIVSSLNFNYNANYASHTVNKPKLSSYIVVYKINVQNIAGLFSDNYVYVLYDFAKLRSI